LDAEVLAAYPSPIAKADALDTKHESWTPLWLFPKSRTIAQNATLANSVEVRCASDTTYRPNNLLLVNGLPSSTYGSEIVVG